MELMEEPSSETLNYIVCFFDIRNVHRRRKSLTNARFAIVDSTPVCLRRPSFVGNGYQTLAANLGGGLT
jgi:hypothetical protein